MRDPKKGTLPATGDIKETLDQALAEADAEQQAIKEAAVRPSRRAFLKGTVAAGALLATGLPARRAYADDDHGVASGNPRPDSVVLWTRVPDGFQLPGAPSRVDWEVATDPAFDDIVASGEALTGPESDYTVRVRAAGLSPMTTYYYRFYTDGGYQSVVGRTLTAPHINAFPEEVRFAFVSCNSFGREFNVYDAMTKDDIHYCAHAGDVVYEGSLGYKLTTVDDYRDLHKHYLSKDEMREARRLFPWIHGWDDHELFNNCQGAVLSDSERAIQAAAYQAYAEYMPLDPEINIETTEGVTELKIYRKLTFGRLFEVFVTDGRQYRDGPVCGREILVGACDDLYDPERTMLGREQTDWLKESLDNSEATWKLVLNGTVMMAMKITNDLAPLFGRLKGDSLRETSEGVVINLDQWDGYPENRKEILGWVKDRGIDNVVVLTGDIHNCYAGQLKVDYANRRRGGVAAVEIVTGSVTSSGIAEALAGYDATNLVFKAFQPANPHIDFVDAYYHVYTRLALRPEQLQATYVAVDTVTSRDYEAFELATLTIPEGEPTLIVDK